MRSHNQFNLKSFVILPWSIMVNLALDRETIYNLLDKARQYQVKDDIGSLDMDDDMDFLHLLSDYNSDVIYQ